MFIYGDAIWVDVNSAYYENSDPELVADLAAIQNSLFNLLSCPLGSRPFQRAYGCQLIAYIMEPADNTTADDLKYSLLQSINTWEPRITVDSNASSVTIASGGDGLDVNLVFIVNKSLQRSRYQYNARRSNV